MRVIAVTGGIGSGKTTLTRLFRAQGARVVDADAISKRLTAAGGEALPFLREAFGDSVFHANGTLNRGALGKLVFGGQTENLRTLNAIMHPMIIEKTKAELANLRAQGVAVTILDAPLLFETGMNTLADTVICVTAPLEVRLRRIRGRDRLTREEALQRIQSQNPTELTESLADFVLTTDAPIDQTREKALAIWARILAQEPKRDTGDQHKG